MDATPQDWGLVGRAGVARPPCSSALVWAVALEAEAVVVVVASPQVGAPCTQVLTWEVDRWRNRAGFVRSPQFAVIQSLGAVEELCS